MLGIRYGVEYCRRSRFRCDGLPQRRKQRAERAANVPGRGNFDEAQRLIRQLGMKGGKAAPVGWLQPPAQLLPSLDLMNGLVANDLLEHGGRGRPIDAANNQKAAIEP